VLKNGSEQLRVLINLHQVPSVQVSEQQKGHLRH